MKSVSKMVAAALCLSAAAGAAFAAGPKKVSAKEGIAVVEAQAGLFSDGYKVTEVTLQYRKKLDPSSVSVDDYAVKGQTITSVAVDGKKVTLGLDCGNRWAPGRGGAAADDANVGFGKYAEVTQTGDVSVAGGKEVYAGPAVVTSKKIAEPKIVREFMEKSYKDDDTGVEIRYCVYMPLYYTEGWNYPCIVFMPDSRANTNISKSCLLQGEGGTVWATEAEQEKQRSIVIAVQYPKYTEDQYGPLVKEDGSWTAGLEAAYRAVRKELSTSRVDRERIYAVGQGEGAAANLLIGEKYPGFYAAQLAVSPVYGIKDSTASALEREKLWIVAGGDDRQSCQAAEAVVAYWKDDGIRTDRAVWQADAGDKAFAAAAREQAGRKGGVKYTVIEGSGREYAWCLAHRVEEIRDWLMAQ